MTVSCPLIFFMEFPDKNILGILFLFRFGPGGVRHDPQRFIGKTVYVPHFNRDTVEFASRERDGSKPGIKILLPFLKNITKERDLENFQDLILALDWLIGLLAS